MNYDYMAAFVVCGGFFSEFRLNALNLSRGGITLGFNDDGITGDITLDDLVVIV